MADDSEVEESIESEKSNNEDSIEPNENADYKVVEYLRANKDSISSEPLNLPFAHYNTFDALWRSVYQFPDSKEGVTEEKKFFCSFLMVHFEKDGVNVEGGGRLDRGLIRVACPELFTTQEELRIHALLHHYDFVIRRVDSSVKGMPPHIVALRKDGNEDSFPVNIRPKRAYEDRLLLKCRTCPHTIDLLVLLRNYVYVAGHVPVSAKLVREMITNFLTPQPQNFQDGKEKPIADQNLFGKIRNLIFNAKGNFEAHSCQTNSELQSTGFRNVSLGDYNTCTKCQTKFNSHMDLRNHYRFPHPEKEHVSLHNNDSSYDQLYASQKLQVNLTMQHGLMGKSEKADPDYFFGSKQYSRFLFEPARLPTDFPDVNHKGTKISSGVILQGEVPDVATEEEITAPAPYKKNFVVDSAETKVIPMPRKLPNWQEDAKKIKEWIKKSQVETVAKKRSRPAKDTKNAPKAKKPKKASDKQADDANLSAHVTVPPPTEPGSSSSMVSAEPTTNPDKQAEDVNPPVETNPSQIVDTSPAHLSIVDTFTEPVLLSPIASAELTTNPDKQAEYANLSAHVTVPPPTEPGSSSSMVNITSAEPTTNPLPALQTFPLVSAKPNTSSNKVPILHLVRAVGVAKNIYQVKTTEEPTVQPQSNITTSHAQIALSPAFRDKPSTSSSMDVLNPQSAISSSVLVPVTEGLSSKPGTSNPKEISVKQYLNFRYNLKELKSKLPELNEAISSPNVQESPVPNEKKRINSDRLRRRGSISYRCPDKVD
ncbi:hypothetical protein TYRP_023145 [Tyrophagus putrescentiae]|nr:hypothetical protein TYRP_023145 [Tyrophagus putrescentiae]